MKSSRRRFHFDIFFPFITENCGCLMRRVSFCLEILQIVNQQSVVHPSTVVVVQHHQTTNNMKFIKFQPLSTEAINNKLLERVPNGYDSLNNLVNLLFSRTDWNPILMEIYTCIWYSKNMREENKHKTLAWTHWHWSTV